MSTFCSCHYSNNRDKVHVAVEFLCVSTVNHRMLQ